MGELLSRSEQDLLDIRNFGSKSIDEVKAKLAEMGLSLKDSAPGFDPSSVIDSYDDDDEPSPRTSNTERASSSSTARRGGAPSGEAREPSKPERRQASDPVAARFEP